MPIGCIVDMSRLSFAFFLSSVIMGGVVSSYCAEPVAPPQKGVTQELWERVKGGSVEDFTQKGAYKQNRPSKTFVTETFDVNDVGDEYGARYSALLSVPKSGEYTFWLAANDTAELWLSSDDQAGNLKKIAELTKSSGPKKFNVEGKSAAIKLEAGKKYYLQALHKEQGRVDHLAVAWEGDGLKKTVIPKENLTPALDGSKAKNLAATSAITKHKTELTAELKKQKTSTIATWLDKLPEKDQKLLAEGMAEEMKALPEEKRNSFLKSYAMLAKGIIADQAHPVKNPAAKSLLNMESRYIEGLSQKELMSYGPHRLAYALGALPTNLQDGVKQTVTLDSKGTKTRDELVSTGVYAIPGKPLTVTLPDSLEKAGFIMEIGHHINPSEKSELVSLPVTKKVFPLTEKKTTVVSPHGGLVLMRVPQKVELKSVPVDFNGGVQAPRFVLGKTTDEEWKSLRNSPAPWGELISEHLTMVVNSDDLKKLENPTELMIWWNENTRRHEDFYAYYPGIAFRMHNALYARQGVSYWPLEWKSENMARLLDVAQGRQRNDGLFLHEHGHHADFGDMEVGYWSESTCNWAGYYMKSQGDFAWKDSLDTHMGKMLNPDDKQHNEIKQDGWYSISTKGTHHWSYPVTSMMLGYTADFSWMPIKETIRRMRDKEDAMYKWDFVQGNMKERAVSDQAKIDRYLIGLSEGAKRDVRPYFAHFQLRPSAGAATYLDKLNLPKWDLSYLPTPAVTSTKAGESLTIPDPRKSVRSMAGETTISWQEKTPHGKAVVSESGDLIYTPDAGFSGEDKISYTLTNPVGSSPVKFLLIQVEK